jgi:hypothetical protein
VRLLAHLLAVAPDRWLLKGGLPLDLRLRGRARTTLDMDLTWQDDETSSNADLRVAQVVDLGDYFTFEIARMPLLDDVDVAGAFRYRGRASLAGRRFEEFVLDVGFAGPAVDKPDESTRSSGLRLASNRPVRSCGPTGGRDGPADDVARRSR